MNDHQSSIDDTQSNTTIVGYSMEECQRRLQSIDESNKERTEQIPYWLTEATTRVIPMATHGDHRAYRVARTGEAETTVLLYPAEGFTRVYIAPPSQPLRGVIWYFRWSFRLGIVLLFPLVYSPTRTIYFAQAGVILAVAVAFMSLNALLRRQQRQHLLRQIMAALGLDESNGG
ncbi:MAG: hypothetical protein K8L91_30280 [Anaerolineae bacterium]|nr:hypothetical protein [Anaerolineae bacterium]